MGANAPRFDAALSCALAGDMRQPLGLASLGNGANDGSAWTYDLNVLHLDREWYVVVEPAMEAVLAVVPRSTRELARVAFEVGNRHFTLAWHEGRALVPDDPAMEQLLKRLEMPFERIRAVFEPLGRGHRHD